MEHAMFLQAQKGPPLKSAAGSTRPEMGSNHVKLPSSDELFRQARDEFLGSLSEKERDRFDLCESMEKLVADIKAQSDFAKSHRRISACLRQVQAFGNNLGPYFKVIELACGSNPEFANIALGALRFILLVRQF